MGHPDSGMILALMEGELPDDEATEVRAHIDACTQCLDLAQNLGEASRVVSGALPHIDVEPNLDRPRSAVLARVADPRTQAGGNSRRSTDGSRSGSWIRWSLPKAASVAVFLTAGVAAALPGSPVRNWVSEWLASPPAEIESSDAEADDPGTAQETLQPAAGVRAHQGAVEIWIHELADDAELLVRWIDGDEAWVQAGAGTRFTSGQGRLEAFSPPGNVQVDIPRALERIELRLNGAVLLRKQGGELEILEPTQERTPSEILFGSPVGTNENLG